ncbi:alpha/beta fold hydrolase [Viridibacillus sp. FSL R5-0477]|uniref:Carboxylesterase n=1 Tax=Viridibacillus arenosi FSL R5-213 TaxID=1227360 RepID=W4EJ46_9BACL|nr:MULTISPECIES: alpha/beta fold hydrolase [Viridibacillus]ETT80633.1 carboxylesterase [Viridibacillus arenosi FSL R5-213]OMC77774.1 carboxylesterase [Viridibacillus sp. FSL H8-0123]OMC82233.1 carboxylesterase [Viridibacillus sp. FSL H7-0596]OMC87528.1 carboxylesterase [Viridibacillus arenosi]
MMKIVPPKPFFYKGGEKAVLLLHSFTSNTIDMKKLGKYLQKNNYSCYAPLYSGHGLTAEELLTYRPSDWWQDVLNGYQLLKDEGFEKIAVIGLSLGGVFALKVGQELEVNGIVTMSVPIHREALFLQKRVFHYAKVYKKFEGKNEEQINLEMKRLQNMSIDSLVEFQQLIEITMDKLALLTSPIRILYGELDDPLYKESAEVIFQSSATNQKTMKGYPNSKHLMTLGTDINDVNKDILTFLNDLTW